MTRRSIFAKLFGLAGLLFGFGTVGRSASKVLHEEANWTTGSGTYCLGIEPPRHYIMGPGAKMEPLTYVTVLSPEGRVQHLCFRDGLFVGTK